MMKEDNPKVYKLVGPVLLAVEIEEAKDNVGEYKYIDMYKVSKCMIILLTMHLTNSKAVGIY